MYYQTVLGYQKSVYLVLSQRNEKKQTKVTFEVLKNRLPPELVYMIVKECRTVLDDVDCFSQDLEFLDNEKELVRMFSFLPPEYLVIVHNSDLWLVAFNIRTFALGMFYVGYLSVLKLIWCSD
jgi:nicotinic acid phosphoribosyltransferase